MVIHTTVDTEPVQIHLVLRGDVSAADGEYARTKVAALTAKFRVPILFARLKLTRGTNPPGRRPALAQVNVEVNGRPVRAQVAAEGMREAIDLLIARLQTGLHHAVEGRGVHHGGGLRDRAAKGGTDHRSARPSEDREVVRHKTYSGTSTTPDDAAFEMELMDYDFHLFTDSATGRESVVYRTEDGGHQLARMEGDEASDVPPAPELSLAEARERLDAGGAPFVFYADRTTGRGNVLYRRFDGDYGLITPTTSA
ncbi:sigma 54 modulation/S30EA ribosomal C-terminal domain-containing protein [Catenulispora subtropica]